MYSQYFGNYLLNKHIISIEELLKALDYQKNIHVKLGVMAINSGYMSAEDVEKIHRKQSRVDKRFGEIAIEMGLLTVNQLDELLGSQKNGHLRLSQALLDLDILSITELNNHLDDYKNFYNISDENVSKISNSDIEDYPDIFLNFGDSVWKNIYIDYIQLLIRNFVRFIDDTPVVFVNKIKRPEIDNWIISQNITGKFNMFTSFSGNEKDLLELGRRFSKEKIETFDALAKDSVSEFLNLHNGIFLVNLSNRGTDLNLSPQKIQNSRILEDDIEIFSVTFSCIWGVIEVIIY